MLSREWYLDVWNGLWRAIANLATAEVLQAIRQVALPLSSATALAQVNWRLAVDNPRLRKSAVRGSSARLLSLNRTLELRLIRAECFQYSPAQRVWMV